MALKQVRLFQELYDQRCMQLCKKSQHHEPTKVTRNNYLEKYGEISSRCHEDLLQSTPVREVAD